MATATLTPNQKVIANIKATVTKVLEVFVSGDSETVIFDEQGKTFALVADGAKGFTIYQCYQEDAEWCFLPTCKQGSTVRVVDNFIASRL